jgi:lysozyme family protein
MVSDQIFLSVYGILAGIGIGWVLSSWLHRGVEGAKHTKVDGIIDACNSRLEIVQQDHANMLAELRSAWTRERSTLVGVAEQYFSELQEIRSLARNSFNQALKSPVDVEEPGSGPEEKDAKVKDAADGEREVQVRSLMEHGNIDRQTAEDYLDGEGDLPSLDTALDRMVYEGTQKGAGLT